MYHSTAGIIFIVAVGQKLVGAPQKQALGAHTETRS